MEGASVGDAVTAVASTTERAGDFGVEIAGSMLAVVLAEGLKTFWAAYLSELEKKFAGKLADLTVDSVKRIFKSDLNGAGRDAVVNQIRTSIRKSGEFRHVSPGSLSSLVDAVPDSADFRDDIS
jgi:hypothetical protein